MDYYKIGPKDLQNSPRIPLLVGNSAGEIHYEIAMQMIEEVVRNNKAGNKTVFICPCGPVEQYPVFARLINKYKISLKDVWIINMDEYVTEADEWISDKDTFSFRYCMEEALYSKINTDLIMPKEQRIFPNPKKPEEIPELIEKLGGVDMAIGGVAFNGHIAFNDPQPGLSVLEFANLPTRIVTLSHETIIKDAILGRGGAFETVPNRAITIGMKEILSARKIRLSMLLDMQRAVVRKACYGEVTSACPVSLVQNHPDALLMISKNVTELPF